jgi:hypothetical protein
MSQKQENSQNPGPPDIPEIKRRIMFHPLQLIGIPLMALIPLLALIGIFGETVQTAQNVTSDFEVNVEYPSRMRDHNEALMQIAVRNLTTETIPLVTVRLPRDYIDSFSEVTMMPDAQAVMADHYEVEFAEVQPGEVYGVRLDLKGEEYGQHEGEVIVEAEGLQSASVRLSTFVFP